MFFSKPIQWYHHHSHADPIWPDGTFKYFLFEKTDTYVPLHNEDAVSLLLKLGQKFTQVGV
jgi:hypothetical protein